MTQPATIPLLSVCLVCLLVLARASREGPVFARALDLLMIAGAVGVVSARPVDMLSQGVAWTFPFWLAAAVPAMRDRLSAQAPYDAAMGIGTGLCGFSLALSVTWASPQLVAGPSLAAALAVSIGAAFMLLVAASRARALGSTRVGSFQWGLALGVVLAATPALERATGIGLTLAALTILAILWIRQPTKTYRAVR